MKKSTIILVTTAFIKDNNGKFLFVKRADDDDFLPGYWEMPGGKTDYGEELRASAAREVKEEVGLDIDPKYLLTTRNYLHESNPYRQYVEAFYIGIKKDPLQEVTLSHEHSEYKWVTFDEAKKMHTTPYILAVLDEIAQHPLAQYSM